MPKAVLWFGMFKGCSKMCFYEFIFLCQIRRVTTPYLFRHDRSKDSSTLSHRPSSLRPQQARTNKKNTLMVMPDAEDDTYGHFEEWLKNNELMPWGWVHTHPSQSAFLSSVDMHSQVVVVFFTCIYVCICLRECMHVCSIFMHMYIYIGASRFCM